MLSTVGSLLMVFDESLHLLHCLSKYSNETLGNKFLFRQIQTCSNLIKNVLHLFMPRQFFTDLISFPRKLPFCESAHYYKTLLIYVLYILIVYHIVPLRLTFVTIYAYLIPRRTNHHSRTEP